MPSLTSSVGGTWMTIGKDKTGKEERPSAHMQMEATVFVGMAKQMGRKKKKAKQEEDGRRKIKQFNSTQFQEKWAQ